MALQSRTAKPSDARFRSQDQSHVRQAVEADQLFDRLARPDQRPFALPDKHFGDERPAVIGAGLGRAIGAGGHHGKEIAGLRLDQAAVEREIVARLADRPDDVGNDSPRPGRALANGADVVVRRIQRRADQIVHAGIDDDEGLGLAALYVDDARHQDAGIADDEAAGLENELAVKALGRALDDRGVGIGIRRRLVVLAIGNAQTAAEIDVA